MYQSYFRVRKSGIKQQQNKNVAKTLQNDNSNSNTDEDEDVSNSNSLVLRKQQIQLFLNNFLELSESAEREEVKSNPVTVLGLRWYLRATKEKEGFLGLSLHAEPPDGFEGNYRVEVDYCNFTIFNTLSAGKDLIKSIIGVVYANEPCANTENKNGHFTCWGVRNMAKFEDLLDSKKGFITPDGTIEVWADFMVKQNVESVEKEELPAL